MENITKSHFFLSLKELSSKSLKRSTEWNRERTAFIEGGGFGESRSCSSEWVVAVLAGAAYLSFSLYLSSTCTVLAQLG